MSTAETKAQTVKERAGYALNNEFLRNAVKFTTERLRLGKKLASEEHGNWDAWRNVGAKSGSIPLRIWIII